MQALQLELFSLPRHDGIKIPFQWMSTDELRRTPAGDFEGDPLTPENQESKRSDSGYLELLESLATDGFLDPVFVESNWIRNGHHRIVAAIDLAYTFVPVTSLYDYGWRRSGTQTY